ncbi:MAG: SDR family oxidoreductase [Chloroflexi bacterium]|nr:SDR family oxidoreductase [Chloroflexota bacterium]
MPWRISPTCESSGWSSRTESWWWTSVRANRETRIEKLACWDKEVPLGRRGVPEYTVKTVLFLASGDSSYITGETICVSGGVYMR